MKCNLIIETNEITIRDYSLIEDEGLISIIGSRPALSFSYEDDEEQPGKHVLIVKAAAIKSLFEFVAFIEVAVNIIC